LLLGTRGIGNQSAKECGEKQLMTATSRTVVRLHIDGGHFVPAVGRDVNGNVLVMLGSCSSQSAQGIRREISDEACAASVR